MRPYIELEVRTDWWLVATGLKIALKSLGRFPANTRIWDLPHLCVGDAQTSTSFVIKSDASCASRIVHEMKSRPAGPRTPDVASKPFIAFQFDPILCGIGESMPLIGTLGKCRPLHPGNSSVTSAGSSEEIPA